MLLVPTALTVMGLEVMGLPLPKSPIWLNGAVLQLVGWQTAVMSAVPGKSGVTDPIAAGIVCGVVELNSKARPLIGLPRVSMTVAIKG